MLLLTFSRTVAADITVTATHVVSPPGNNGALHVEIDASITDMPFVITITNALGVVTTQTINSHTFNYGNLPTGNYCVNVATQSGCEATACVTIIRCKKFGSSYMCSIVAEGCCKEALIVTGDPSAYINAMPSNFNFEAHYPPVFAGFDMIQDDVFAQSLAIAQEIVAYGASPYDIPEQNEIETDAMFVFKFDSSGHIIWAYHRYAAPESFQRADAVFRQPGSGPEAAISVYPNPANDMVNVVFQPGIFHSVTLTGLTGRQITTERIGTPDESLQINIADLPAGAYMLQFNHIDGTTTVSRFVKMN